MASPAMSPQLPQTAGPVTREPLEQGHGTLAALETYSQKDTSKVVIRFQPSPNAPVLKQKFYKITASNKFQAVIAFLRKELGWKPSDSLFCYINAAFSPAPDDTVGNLYKCYGTAETLIVNYSATPAWG